jgi:hypothetical protein
MFSVNATDKDSGLNGEVIYKLQNIDDVPFGIDPFSRFFLKIYTCIGNWSVMIRQV